jgi:hypothetical protein
MFKLAPACSHPVDRQRTHHHTTRPPTANYSLTIKQLPIRVTKLTIKTIANHPTTLNEPTNRTNKSVSQQLLTRLKRLQRPPSVALPPAALWPPESKRCGGQGRRMRTEAIHVGSSNYNTMCQQQCNTPPNKARLTTIGNVKGMRPWQPTKQPCNEPFSKQVKTHDQTSSQTASKNRQASKQRANNQQPQPTNNRSHPTNQQTRQPTTCNNVLTFHEPAIRQPDR